MATSQATKNKWAGSAWEMALLKGLREEGYTVEHVADGRDGLYLASASTFDAIVMDRMVPKVLSRRLP